MKKTTNKKPAIEKPDVGSTPMELTELIIIKKPQKPDWNWLTIAFLLGVNLGILIEILQKEKRKIDGQKEKA